MLVFIIIVVAVRSGQVALLKETVYSLEKFELPSFKENFSFYQEDYLLELVIPSINLEEVVYDIDSSFNDVDLHIELLKDSDLERGVYFLAGHSGSGKASYFNDLVNIKIGDFIWIRTLEEEYCYVVDDCFSIYKNGYLEIEDGLSDVLFLITCSLKDAGEQLIVRAHLV